jgi:hypothetical protein
MSYQSDDVREHEREAAERDPAERSPEGEREAGEPAVQREGDADDDDRAAPPAQPRQA